jgi:hypothetical protein
LAELSVALLRLYAHCTVVNLSGAGTMNGGVHGVLVLFPGREEGSIVCMSLGEVAGKIPTHHKP